MKAATLYITDVWDAAGEEYAQIDVDRLHRYTSQALRARPWVTHHPPPTPGPPFPREYVFAALANLLLSAAKKADPYGNDMVQHFVRDCRPVLCRALPITPAQLLQTFFHHLDTCHGYTSHLDTFHKYGLLAVEDMPSSQLLHICRTTILRNFGAPCSAIPRFLILCLVSEHAAGRAERALVHKAMTHTLEWRNYLALPHILTCCTYAQVDDCYDHSHGSTWFHIARGLAWVWAVNEERDDPAVHTVMAECVPWMLQHPSGKAALVAFADSFWGGWIDTRQMRLCLELPLHHPLRPSAADLEMSICTRWRNPLIWECSIDEGRAFSTHHDLMRLFRCCRQHRGKHGRYLLRYFSCLRLEQQKVVVSWQMPCGAQAFARELTASRRLFWLRLARGREVGRYVCTADCARSRACETSKPRQ